MPIQSIRCHAGGDETRILESITIGLVSGKIDMITTIVESGLVTSVLSITIGMIKKINRGQATCPRFCSSSLAAPNAARMSKTWGRSLGLY